jgi:hypothetical protein
MLWPRWGAHLHTDTRKDAGGCMLRVAVDQILWATF